MEDDNGINVTASLMLKLLEYVKETPDLEDEDLHELVDIMSYISSDEDAALSMSDYDTIVGNTTDVDFNEEFESVFGNL